MEIWKIRKLTLKAIIQKHSSRTMLTADEQGEQ